MEHTIDSERAEIGPSSKPVVDLRAHRAGFIAGAIALIGVFFKNYAFLFVIIPVLSVAAYTVIYSYFDYQKEMK